MDDLTIVWDSYCPGRFYGPGNVVLIDYPAGDAHDPSTVDR
jgi:hypothetical protein